jgi:hypothetical protein
VFCPSCGEFISTDNPKICPFCKTDVEHYVLPPSRTWGIPGKSVSPFSPQSEVPPAGGREFNASALQFRRESGPRKFIEKKLPRCPFCRTSEPDWAYAEVAGWLKRANFRCGNCRGILSVPLEAMSPWKSAPFFGSMGFSEYLRIEWVGDRPELQASAPKLVGGEFPLEKLRTWADRSSAEILSSAS